MADATTRAGVGRAIARRAVCEGPSVEIVSCADVPAAIVLFQDDIVPF
jgi:hypothetical protein